MWRREWAAKKIHVKLSHCGMWKAREFSVEEEKNCLCMFISISFNINWMSNDLRETDVYWWSLINFKNNMLMKKLEFDVFTHFNRQKLLSNLISVLFLPVALQERARYEQKSFFLSINNFIFNFNLFESFISFHNFILKWRHIFRINDHRKQHQATIFLFYNLYCSRF